MRGAIGYLISGKVPAARPLIDRLQTLDPLTPLTRCLPGFADASEGNLERAVELYRQMFEMDPGNPMGRLFYIWVLALTGRYDDLVRVLDGFHRPSGTRCLRVPRASSRMPRSTAIRKRWSP